MVSGPKDHHIGVFGNNALYKFTLLKFYPSRPVPMTPIRIIPLEFHWDLWHQKTVLLCGFVCIILHSAIFS